MNIQPLGDRVLIEPMAVEEKTKSGIILPDTADKEKPEQGKIIEVGPGTPKKPMTVKKGDIVLFTKYSPNEIKVDGREYLIAREEDILAILKK
ncbi:co-chaperone GroES [Patescibacteria group bacterium]|nr:co-chaperone GroES [Patescibacteria group bacterium]MBU2068557.1 co-chaperone GroES [Patescibacteria group bacterium]